MRIAYAAIGILTLILPAAAGDLIGHAIVTKHLTKKAMAPVVYNLRGTPAPVSPSDAQPINEFDRIVVILEGGSLPRPGPVTAVLDQRNIRFAPNLIVVPVGSTIEFPNSDPIFHSVFSLSKAHPFDLGFYPQGQTRTVKFDRAGVVQVYCHIHSNMYAAIVVTASPWYAKPASDGAFTWHDIPAGHYRLTAWHTVAGLHEVDVDVPPDGTVDVKIRVPVDVEQHP